MREARPEGSPYPKADLWLRGLARGVDFLIAFGLATLGHELGAVLAVIYLIFNEGYAATGGRELVRDDLCAEAICLLYTSPSPRDMRRSRMPSSA